jgi:predicted unusual protein kinase regulating ubiquinone biosynthesis (AarF/ABC1/UbiB family)
MEFIHGCKISDLEGIKKLGLDLKDVCFFESLLLYFTLI